MPDFTVARHGGRAPGGAVPWRTTGKLSAYAQTGAHHHPADRRDGVKTAKRRGAQVAQGPGRDHAGAVQCVDAQKPGHRLGAAAAFIGGKRGRAAGIAGGNGRIEAVEIAGPGFINIHLAAASAGELARTVVEAVAYSKNVAEAMHEYMQTLPPDLPDEYANVPVAEYDEGN